MAVNVEHVSGLVRSLHKQALTLFSYNRHPLLVSVITKHGLTADRNHIEEYFKLASKV